MLSVITALHKGKSLVLFLLTQLFTIVIFAIIYWILIVITKKPDIHFYGLSKKSSLLDFLYYSITTQAAVGYGDIVPMSKIAKILAMTQMVMIYLGIGISEHEVIKSLVKKRYLQPILLIIAFIIAAFAPPILNIFVHIFSRKDKINKQRGHKGAHRPNEFSPADKQLPPDARRQLLKSVT